MRPANIITNNEAVIFLDEVNKTYFVNSAEGREQMRTSLSLMNMPEVINDILAQWGENPTVEPQLEELKNNKLSELESSFEEHVAGSFQTNQGYTMQFNVSDSLKMQGAITLMDAVNASTGYITQANDETIYNVPIETMKAVLVEMLNAYAQCHARKQELRSLINNAQTKEELDEIVISWPI